MEQPTEAVAQYGLCGWRRWTEECIGCSPWDTPEATADNCQLQAPTPQACPAAQATTASSNAGPTAAQLCVKTKQQLVGAIAPDTVQPCPLPSLLCMAVASLQRMPPS